MDEPELTPKLLLQAYASGIFPMAESQDDPTVFWVDPSRRGILPLEKFHISRSLRKVILSGRFQSRFNSDFAATVAACAEREETWINATIFDLYIALNRMGFAHSQEIWEDDELVGGVYGVALGGAFFGESMFSRRTDASKVALAYLIDRLRLTGFTLFDTQFITPHLRSLGGEEIDRSVYLDRLEQALLLQADITTLPAPQTPQDVIQRNTQTS